MKPQPRFQRRNPLLTAHDPRQGCLELGNTSEKSDPAAHTEERAAVVAWTAVLDSLELSVDEAFAGTLPATSLVRQALALGNWTPPDVEGPIPAELVTRARRIQLKQREALSALRDDLESTRKHQSALGAVRSATTRGTSGAVYLDAVG